MKIKKTRITISLLILILSVTIVGPLNKKYTSQHILETPKSSAGEITVITPENKIYTDPDSGYYPGTFGFENDLNGAIPFGWVDTSSAPCYAKIIDGIGGRYKVMEVYGRGQTSSDYARILNNFQPQSTGTIEWWWRKSSTLSSCAKFHVLQDGAELIDLRMDWYADTGKIEYEENGWVNTGYSDYADDKWIHMKLSFDCTSDVYSLTIDGVLYLNNIPFHNGDTATYLNNIKFYTYAAGNPTLYFVDAVSYSWDSNYDIGDNLNEGLLLSYDNTTTLDWQGYSLDGLDNVTISGNYTIPVPVNGTHSIQVFGNNSIGTIYQSNLRYFSYGAPTVPEITIISPTPDQFFNNNSPDFQISTLGVSIDTTWYTIDDGITNITFSGLTGAIDQTEWDKKGDGDINLRFYVNSTLGNSSYTDVTIKKETTPPLITIDSPLENELFGKLAPYFNLTIIEPNIDQMWYTLDYGVTNITHVLFNGTINQSEWNKIGNGTANIRFSVLDKAGNLAYEDITLRKKISDPIVVINNPSEDELFGFNAPFFNISVIEPHFGSMWYTLDDGINNVTATGFTGDISQTEWNKKSSGMITIKFYANDTLGNTGYAEIAVEKDITDPTIQINTPLVDAIFGYSAPNYDISITEANLDSMWYTLDNGLNYISISSFTGDINQTEWNKKGSGTVPIRFYANDTIGNTDYTEVLVIKDLIDPIVTIISPNENEIFGSGTPTYEISVTESNPDLMWYTLDSGATNVSFGSSTGTINQTEWDKQGNGTVTIRFYAEDEAGNSGFAEILILKDVNIPLITINTPSTNDITGLLPPIYDISVVEPNIKEMWYTLDSGTTNVTFSSLTGTIDQTEWDKFGNGLITIRFYIRDKSDNEAFAEVSVSKDLVAPVITITAPQFGAVFLDISPLYSISIDEPNLDSFWYSLDGGNTNITITTLIGAISDSAWSPIPDGHVTLTFYAKDEAGNIGQNSVLITKSTTEEPAEPPPGIPGYDLYLLIGVLSVISARIIRKRLKS